MALHGAIKVNGNILGAWTAVRVTNTEDAVLTPDAVSEYECSVGMLDGDQFDFNLTHRFGDGALVLASSILREAVLRKETGHGTPTEGERQ